MFAEHASRCGSGQPVTVHVSHCKQGSMGAADVMRSASLDSMDLLLLMVGSVSPAGGGV